MPDDHAAVLGEPFEQFYTRTASLLLYLAHVRFDIALPDAEALVQDAFLKWLRDYDTIRNPRGWLIAAVCNASRNHYRDHRHEVPLPLDFDRWCDVAAEEELNRIPTRLAVSAALTRLDERCADMLYRHHVDNESVREIAASYAITPSYAKLLLHLCRKRARELYLMLTAVVIA